MLLARARLGLTLIWVLGSTPALIIVVLQTLYQTSYGRGEQWDKGFLWLFPAVLPQIATVLAPSIIQRQTKKVPPLVRRSVFWALVIISVIYLVILYSGIFTGIVEYQNENWDYVFHMSTWLFLIFQLIFFAAYSGLFIEGS